ncbi:MAG: cell wall-binding repeat-containing protein [Oscillospiraceae bacterium]|nr:cell wall-binding repeat-containing protein [Oscillospiraceae bacterium]
MKRVLAWILSFVMLAGLLPVVQVRAVEVVPLETVPVSYINPLYADVMDESQLPQPGVMPLAEVEYLETTEEAGTVLREGIKARQETIVIGLKTEAYTDELLNQIVAECHKHTGDPEEGDYIYWQYSGVGGNASGYEEGGYQYLTLTLTPRYYTTAAQEDQLDTEIANLLASLNLSGKDDYGKLKAIYDWMCVNITYDNEHLNDSSYTRMRTAYGALMDRTAICQGYVALLYRLLLEVGIDNRVVAGLGDGGAHGWNIVELNGLYYNVDSTWDATYTQAGVDYAYFLKTDKAFSEDHVRYEEYTTEEFYAAYPMAESDYVPGETQTPEEPHTHSYTAAVIDPTCTEKGYTVYTCSCGDSYTDNETESIGHSWNDGEVTREPTVDTEGEKTFTCTLCSETMTEAVPKLDDHVHSYEWQYDEYEHWRECECGEVTDKGYHDAALMACGQTAPCDGCGVEIVWDREHEDDDGDDICDACGWGMEAVAGGILEDCCWVVENGWLMVYGTEEMPSLGSAEEYPWYAYRDLVEVVYVLGIGVGDHAFQGYDKLYGVLVSTDADTGRSVSVLGSEAFADNDALEYIIFKDEAPEIAEDAFRGVTAEVEYDGTWGENLLQDYGGTLTWAVTGDEPHTHSYAETVTDPTCTEKGYTTYTCSCGDSYTDNETDPLGHSWNDGEITKEPTVDAEGEKTFTCIICEATMTEAIPKLDDHVHSYEWQHDEYQHWQVCECGETTEKENHDAADMACGQTTLCESCGVEIVWDREHEDADGDNFCDVCNWRMDIIAGGSGDGWFWGLGSGVLQFSGSGEMPAYDSAEEYPWYRYQDQVEMVAVYGVDIGDHAFQGYPNLMYAYAGTDEDTGASVSSIGAEAFGDCAALEEVVFSAEAPEIAEDAFTAVTAQVTYNGTWDSSLCKDYGGSLTWVTEGGEEEHTHSYTETVTDPTCTEQGYTTYTCSCGDSYTDDFTDPLGHTEVIDEAVEATCTETGLTEGKHCSVCEIVLVEQEIVPKKDHQWEEGRCTVCGEEEDPTPDNAEIYRLAGANRFETAFLVADQMKVNLGVEKFDAIIVASGTNFADALGGSYLSAVKNAPILLSYKGAYNEMAKNYIIANLKPGGTVYILGGPSAVPASMETGLGGFTIKRLAGEDRFGTNLAILQEAGVGDKDILVCTGLSFADSLSASASELPILLVWKNLTEGQKGFLNKLNGNKLYIIGGETAVSSNMEKQVSAYGETRRIGGKNRFETSVLIAEEFFDSPDSAVLAYAWNYPDGLCGGGLAAVLDAPLILTMNKFEAKAEEYIQSQGISNGYVLGTGELISDETVQNIIGPDVVLK